MAIEIHNYISTFETIIIWRNTQFTIKLGNIIARGSQFVFMHSFLIPLKIWLTRLLHECCFEIQFILRDESRRDWKIVLGPIVSPLVCPEETKGSKTPPLCIHEWQMWFGSAEVGAKNWFSLSKERRKSKGLCAPWNARDPAWSAQHLIKLCPINRE